MTRTKFKIPLQAEVEGYIKTKKGWPDKFVKYYAEKFWNHYQASGWKLSNGNSVKDWKAAFNSQWQTPKYKEDIEFLNKCGQNHKMENAKNTTGLVGQVDALLRKYQARPTDVAFSEFGQFYDLLKQERLLREFSKQDVEDIKEAYNGDKEKCRCACVQKTFDSYTNTAMTFGDIMEMRRRLNG